MVTETITIQLTPAQANALRIAANRGISALLNENSKYSMITADAANDAIQAVESVFKALAAR